jgi:hypothetical protein
MVARKLMVTVFFNRKRSVANLMDSSNATSYCKTQRKLFSAIKNKGRGMLTHGAVLFRIQRLYFTTVDYFNW